MPCGYDGVARHYLVLLLKLKTPMIFIDWEKTGIKMITSTRLVDACHHLHACF